MRSFALITFVLGVSVVHVNGCASVGGPRDHCAPAAGDSVYRAFAPVYRACAVERPAKASGSDAWTKPLQSAVTSSGASQSCSRAKLEFVVDTTGSVIRNSIRVVSTNDQSFADEYAEHVVTWTFDPATIAGTKVRQIVTYSPRLLNVNASGRSGQVLVTPAVCSDE